MSFKTPWDLQNVGTIRHSIGEDYIDFMIDPSLVNINRVILELDRILQSDHGCRVLASSNAAMNAIVASSTALDKVLSSSLALDSVAASKIAMDAIASSSTAMNMVLSSSSAINEIFSSSVAINAIFSSNTAKNAIFSSSSTMNAIFSSSVTMSLIASSNIAMNAIASSNAAMNAIVASSTAINAIASSNIAMDAIASSSTAMNIIIKSQTVSTIINTAMQSRRSSLLTALSDTSKFTKTTINVGAGGGTFTSGLNSNTIYIPISCYDDNDTDYKVYSGVDNNNIVVSINRHSGTVNISSGVCLRGTTVLGVGSSVGYVTFDVYTAI